MNKKKKFRFGIFFIFILNILLVSSSVLLILNVLKLNGIEDTIRYAFCGIYGLLALILCFLNLKNSIKKKKVKLFFSVFISIILIVGNVFISYNANRFLGVLNKITKNNQVVSISLATLSGNKISSKEEISKDDKIGIISEELSGDMSSLIEEYIMKNVLKNDTVKYDNYYDLLKDLYSGKIKYSFIPTEYNSILSQYEESFDLEKIKIIDTYEKSQEIEWTEQKSLSSPFTVLLMGVDTLSTAYNADTLMVITFNPDTLNATILSIPRDTYTKIACTGGNHKINSSGLNGDKCVVSTVEKYLDIKIDYYFKVNFKGLVNIVDLLGGIETDVPYSFCEQDSNRKWGKNTVYVKKGLQTLNGEQALALSRNRHYWPKKCSKEWTTEGVRNDFIRGQNQQLVFKSILNKVKDIRSAGTVYKLMDTLSDNMVTNMSTDTMLSLYNVGKNIVSKMNYQNRDISQILTIQRLKFTSYGQKVLISNLNLDTVINTEGSVNAVKKAMKENLGLLKPEIIKTFEFDINNSYEENIIGTGIQGSSNSVVTLPDFVGKSYDYAKKWLTSNGIKVNYEYEDTNLYSKDIVISQSVKANADISNIKSITLTLARPKEEVKTEDEYKPASNIEDNNTENNSNNNSISSSNTDNNNSNNNNNDNNSNNDNENPTNNE